MTDSRARKNSSHLRSPTNSGLSNEGTLEAAQRQQQDGLIQEQEEITSDKLPTIIPFPSDEAQAVAGQPDPQESSEIHEGGGKPGARQSSGTDRTLRDWSQFTRVREKHTFEERIERKKRKYKQKLRRAQLARPRGAAPTIIPFPSEQTQALDGSDDPPGDT